MGYTAPQKLKQRQHRTQFTIRLTYFHSFSATLYFTIGSNPSQQIIKLVYSKLFYQYFITTIPFICCHSDWDTHTDVTHLLFFLYFFFFCPCWFINIRTHGFFENSLIYIVCMLDTFVRWMESRMHIFRMNFDSWKKKKETKKTLARYRVTIGNVWEVELNGVKFE